MIVEEFEKNPPIPTSVDDWINDAERISLYISAGKYIEAHG